MRTGGGVLFRATVRPAFVFARDGLVRLAERRYGIRTSGVVPLAELTDPDRVHYKPAPWLAFDLDIAVTRARFTDPVRVARFFS